MSNESHRRQENEPQDAPASQDLGGLLGEILGGLTGEHPPENNPPAASNPPKQGGDQVLGSLSGSSPAPVSGQGHNTPSAPNPNMGGDLGGLLGSLFGGGSGAGNMGGQGGDAMGGMLGGLLGGLMGGGGSGVGNMGAMGGAEMSSVLSPLADALSSKLGISREVALTALTILVPVILNKLMSGQQSGGDPMGSLQKAIQSGQGLSVSPSEHDQMVSQLTSQTGLSHHEASQTLTQALNLLGGQ